LIPDTSSIGRNSCRLLYLSAGCPGEGKSLPSGDRDVYTTVVRRVSAQIFAGRRRLLINFIHEVSRVSDRHVYSLLMWRFGADDMRWFRKKSWQFWARTRVGWLTV